MLTTGFANLFIINERETRLELATLSLGSASWRTTNCATTNSFHAIYTINEDSFSVFIVEIQSGKLNWTS
ncbi:MAG TPA: hypothetical protein VFG46_18390 [Chryseolinea sp.]|nr:hypothetical protein [Chryseolinea sp.]